MSKPPQKPSPMGQTDLNLRIIASKSPDEGLTEARRSSVRYNPGEGDDWDLTPVVTDSSKLDMGFFRTLLSSSEERNFVEGCRDLVFAKEAQALEHLLKARELPDAAFLAGFIALRRDRVDDAKDLLEHALAHNERLGEQFSEHGMVVMLSIPVTEEYSALVLPDRTGALLGLVEVYQRQGDWEAAFAAIQSLMEALPDDVTVRLSFSELLLEGHPDPAYAHDKVLRLSEGIEGTTKFHAALALYRGRALRETGQVEAARALLRHTLDTTPRLDARLGEALKYALALCLELLGDTVAADNLRKEIALSDADYAPPTIVPKGLPES